MSRAQMSLAAHSNPVLNRKIKIGHCSMYSTSRIKVQSLYSNCCALCKCGVWAKRALHESCDCKAGLFQ